jgi:hypothetical protein
MTRRAFAFWPIIWKPGQLVIAFLAMTAISASLSTESLAVTTLYVSDATGRPGEAGVKVRITTSNAVTIGSSDLVLTFDPTILEAVEASSRTLGSFTWYVDNTLGTMTTASASGGGDNLPAGSEVFSVTFNVRPTARCGAASALGLRTVHGANEFFGVPPPIPPPSIPFSVVAGTLSVTCPSPTPTPTPTLTLTPTPTPTVTLASSQTPTLSRTFTRPPTPTVTPVPDGAIIVGDATGFAGRQVTFEVRLQTGRALIAGVQNDITYDPNFGMISPKGNGRPDCSVNPDIDKSSTSFTYLPPGCTPGSDCTGIRAIVFSTANVSPIPDRSVLYTCKFAIAPRATGTSVLINSNARASDPEGKSVQVAVANGSIIASPLCPGDCGRDGQVTIDELITMVNIALGTRSVSECSVGDTSGDGQITIDEIIQAVNRALNGC